ncbi:MAG: DnaA/Hda family protein, partial [Patescibacteria group bacterium]
MPFSSISPLKEISPEPINSQAIVSNEELWQAVLAQIQFSVSRANFATWFRNTRIISNKNGEVLVSVPNSFSREWLGNKYQSAILKILRDLDNNIRLVEFTVDTENEKNKRIAEPTGRPTAVFASASEAQQQFPELNVNQKTNLNFHYTFESFVVGEFNELAHAASWAVAEAPGITYNPLFIYGGVGLGKTHLLQATGNRL